MRVAARLRTVLPPSGRPVDAEDVVWGPRAVAPAERGGRREVVERADEAHARDLHLPGFDERARVRFDEAPELAGAPGVESLDDRGRAAVRDGCDLLRVIDVRGVAPART